MTDDIVIRLRKAHEEAKQWIEGGRWLCPKTIHSEAADEIERLRVENQVLREALDTFDLLPAWQMTLLAKVLRGE